MRVAEMMKDTFSPHELAALAGPPALILFFCGALFAKSAHPLMGLLLLALSPVWGVSLGILSLCPKCGKSPWKYQPFGNYRFPSRLPPRLWPEHECSACRTSLDGI